MGDLETLGTSSNSVILSIGAVAFNEHTGVTDTFFTAVDKDSCLQAGLVIDSATEIWWSKQSAEAKAQFKDPIPLKSALMAFCDFIGKDDLVWGNGVDFDNVILANAYKACGETQPWNFRNNRCYRTLKNLFPYIKCDRHETPHHALGDAKYQARHLMKILKEIRKCHAVLS